MKRNADLIRRKILQFYIIQLKSIIKNIKFFSKKVRLGEYNTETDIDCIYEADNTTSCADPPVDIEIEQIVPHPQYNSSDFNKNHDAALIRLKTPVTFTDYIQPICLPSESDTYTSGMKFHIAGWGKTNICK